MSLENEIIKYYVLEAGLWKVYLSAISFGLISIYSMTLKDKKFLDKLLIISSAMLCLVSVAFILIANS